MPSIVIVVPRMCLAIYLVLDKKGTWVLEQAASSMIWRHPRMQQLLKVARVPRNRKPFDPVKFRDRPVVLTIPNAVQPASSYSYASSGFPWLA